MLKIFNTQLNGIFSKIDAQLEEIEIASQLLMQAANGEGSIFIKTFDEIDYFNDFMTKSNESLPHSKTLDHLDEVHTIDSTDRVLLVGSFFTAELNHWIQKLNDLDIDFVVIANKDKDHKSHENLMHYIDLSTPRAIVPTADFSKIITPHIMALNYIYYIMFAEMYEMTQDLNEA
ncbi:DUF2529 family protein [Mammaliicoccus vitulinus]|uniref:DUF2529 family protein n=1 Tax=Mammaliicoccus vitulinus TaxID=71237 RepID=A0ABX7HC26_9STAP|nr:DUF2529 family protein [Mammaliicoccus vitulinus]PNZ40620.1 DUF2529 domain-containing protein [Mammaliicoccus vitulinus]QRO84183.1 DUF2529 family protein [Mammaliicoccus vitulinus]QTN11444.1 DUF2529 family protein [Mammaliicoccus vitulinus]WQK88575.1 DUF2529 family protein [Mammaliicoccus vitulinus]